MNNKKLAIVITLGIIILAIPFYWYAIRPSQIKRSCSLIEIKGISEQEKEKIKELFDKEKCSELGISYKVISRGWKTIGNIDVEKDKKIKLCNKYAEEINTPNEDSQKNATDDEYKQCLRENGL